MTKSYLEGYTYYEQGTLYKTEKSLEVYDLFCHILSHNLGASLTPAPHPSLLHGKNSTNFSILSSQIILSSFFSYCLKLFEYFIFSFIKLISTGLTNCNSGKSNLLPLDPFSAVFFLVTAQFLALGRCLVNVHWVIYFPQLKKHTCFFTES